ncbi:hypothetical protein PTTG_00108 [Puccinia triticina 1-1 BBBD Race 1]|uniref:Glutaminase n=2 Tax=Puccinia triticina TaxID=208348 RepID=A0A180GWX3_PUCT1|nr:uncharacterized protein PtA15_6A246 [Puccinia triticina]OAV97021.1 hypothetical protein PTTG_00108 [Puccinia triticina 1-1 BBBD Race 1]WAQ85618.1 hypothetical protein PtA15_6A246 [Puccinia triticina]
MKLTRALPKVLAPLLSSQLINSLETTFLQKPLIPQSLPSSLLPLSDHPTNSSSFYPLLPPAIPLAVKSPYLSAWLATGQEGGNGGYLAGRWAQLWPIQFPQNPFAYRLGWAGLIQVNGETYEFMGRPNEDFIGNRHRRAVQRGFRYTSSRSIFEFDAGGLRFLVTFLSPIGPEGDLVRQSLPFSYLTIELIEETLRDTDQVSVYTDIQADWASGDHNVNATWSIDHFDQSVTYKLGRQEQLTFAEQFEYAEWGQVIYATEKVPGLTTASGVASQLRSHFVSHGKLNGDQDEDYRKISDQTAGLAYSVPLSRHSKSAVFVIGHIRDPYVQSIENHKGRHREGKLSEKWGYWRSVFNLTDEAIKFSLKDYPTAVQTADFIDKKIEDDARRVGGEDYVAIASLSARQALGGIEITIGKDEHGNYDPTDVAAFLKEISSNGDMSTVDVIFPQFPVLAYLDPQLLKLLLEPIFKYSTSGLYPNRWTVHDLGRYPNATGHNDGKDEPMPVEEAGNILIMSLAYHQLAKDDEWLAKHYVILKQWAGFLVDDGLIPAKQLSTDDFAGTLANQTNLALKAIVGIGAMAQIACTSGYKEEGSSFRTIAEKFVDQWIGFSLNESGNHTKLAYQLKDSWGTLYNLFGDRLLNLKLVPERIYRIQDDYYPHVANQFGVPLDSRHTWAKTDWQMFAAGAAITIQTRDLFLNKLVTYLKANKVNAGFPDLYETETAEFPGRSKTSTWRIEFINRPVSGGHFSILALDKLNKANGVTEFPFRNRHRQSNQATSAIQPGHRLETLAKLGISWGAVMAFHQLFLT